MEHEEGGPAKKKAKKEKRVKDPLAPKRPACANLLFFHSMKAEVTFIHILLCIIQNQVMASKPEMTYKEVMIEMGRVWNHELDEEQKAPFQAQHQQLLVEWKKAMQVFKKLGDVNNGEQAGEVKEEDLKRDVDKEIENAPEDRGDCAEAEEEGILGEKGDLKIKEDPEMVQELGELGGEVKEEDCKRDEEDMEAEVRGVDTEADLMEKGDVRKEDLEELKNF